jgi:hypothetical protein
VEKKSGKTKYRRGKSRSRQPSSRFSMFS